MTQQIKVGDRARICRSATTVFWHGCTFNKNQKIRPRSPEGTFDIGSIVTVTEEIFNHSDKNLAHAGTACYTLELVEDGNVEPEKPPKSFSSLVREKDIASTDQANSETQSAGSIGQTESRDDKDSKNNGPPPPYVIVLMAIYGPIIPHDRTDEALGIYKELKDVKELSDPKVLAIMAKHGVK